MKLSSKARKTLCERKYAYAMATLPKRSATPDPKSYLSTSGGKWRCINQGMPVCRDGSEAEARAAAARFKLDLSHGRVWDGDALAWRRETESS